MGGKPAVTLGSNHICPMCSGTVPHVGGPVAQGEANVLFNGKPVATMGSMCTCVGPPDMVAQGNPSVLINGKPISTVGDMTAHGGVIVSGEANIIIGSATPEPPSVTPPVQKIPFPKITLTNRILGNAKKAIANQEALRKEAESTEGEPKVYNLQWRKEETVIRDRKVLKVVTLTADVINIPDGETATIKVLNISNDDDEDTQVVELTGTVKDKRITVEWELEDASANDNENSNS
ncbi:MAG: hypothetical protein CR968_02510 [Flavobacteriia bacterium]|nr:MAG: hypothetical protein CR968_02510 [Flavobacteriia bacterium]